MADRSLRERGFAAWPEDAQHAGTQDETALNQRIYMQYLGVLTLMGRIVRRNKLAADDFASVEQAFVDANVVLRRRKSGLYYDRASDGGYAAFEE